MRNSLKPKKKLPLSENMKMLYVRTQYILQLQPLNLLVRHILSVLYCLLSVGLKQFLSRLGLENKLILADEH